MTEAQWNRCKDPQTMLAFLIGSGNTSERKLRLFAVACCRRIWPLIRNPKHKIVIEAAERYADGDLSFRALQESLQLIGNPQHRRTAAASRSIRMTSRQSSTSSICTRDTALRPAMLLT